MFQPGQVLERIDACLDGVLVGQVSLVSRPDLEQLLAWATDARPAGFNVELPLGRNAPTRLDLLGYGGNAPPVRLSCLVPVAVDDALPAPPKELALRVAKLHGPVFRAQGLKMFTDLTDQMARLGISSAGRLLDWGCGCGRVAAFFLTRQPETRLIGCDIDGEAIEWCRHNLPGEFIRIEPMPPMPLPDAAVDLIIGCSVLTHLGATDQDRWLREIRRILAPGGHFLASTNADFMFQMRRHRRPGGKLKLICQQLTGVSWAPRHLSGIKERRSRTLDGIAPSHYYRAVYQSRAHTVEACSKYYDVVDYVEHGLNGHQDLIVLRRGAG